MGGSLSFTVGADSIAEPGQKSIICEGLDGVDADKLISAFEEYVKEGKTATGKESKFEVEPMDGGYLTTQKYDLPAMWGGGSFTVRNLFKFDPAARKFLLDVYLNDPLWEARTPSSVTSVVIHTGPVKIEAWADAKKVRVSGRILKSMLEHAFKEVDITAVVTEDKPSIGEPGKLSVVSEAITDGDASAENFLDKFKSMLVDKMGATELPDGTVIEDRSGFMEVLNGVKNFAKHVFVADENKLYIHEYGEDESLSLLRSITVMQVHKEPFRVEMWNESQGARLASDTELRVVKPFVEKVLEFMQSKA